MTGARRRIRRFPGAPQAAVPRGRAGPARAAGGCRSPGAAPGARGNRDRRASCTRSAALAGACRWRWPPPVLVAFTVVLNVMAARKVDNVRRGHSPVRAQRIAPGSTRTAPTAPAAAPAARTASDLRARAAAMPRSRDRAPTRDCPADATAPSKPRRAVAKASSTPAWRHDSQTWLAEIEQLRAAGQERRGGCGTGRIQAPASGLRSARTIEPRDGASHTGHERS